ncbi:family 34 glycosyltransferase [Sodiomyces alkalinus F11]|uniref:Family 34 glycosyltransferase n=1 Tax=Sodiomyces alkalinus (strain CBS 110278 / VKM F-3762 / F11) TaxID=1314773 RepID=A0A3N2Q902_SODAK|nr:family 34 glycosyltransferase [Sodiomyces alkalinus F11]ROT43259.1 family 34 glycosyltransferase [Sodiomyces alkalinus F11]
MHFAYPSRKSSNPPPFRPRQSRIPIPTLRKGRLKSIAVIATIIIGSFWIISKLFDSRDAPLFRRPSGNPPVVLVTVLDERKHGMGHSQSIRENREQYAKRHGYETMFVHAGDYELEETAGSWARTPAMRHALTNFPECRYVWFLDQDAYIMEPAKSLEERLLEPDLLGKIMRRDISVVPNSIIKTFSHLKGGDIELVLTQDFEGLSTGSLVVRNGEWAKFFLETWFDPLYRSYKFRKAEEHALEHMVQWHPTILSKLAVVPQRTINSYIKGNEEEGFQEGDFVVRAAGCGREGAPSCEEQLSKYRATWQQAFSQA